MILKDEKTVKNVSKELGQMKSVLLTIEGLLRSSKMSMTSAHGCYISELAIAALLRQHLPKDSTEREARGLLPA
jgi:hypothetical protein